MITRKQLLVMLCLLFGITQMQEVRAQADPITAITYRLVPVATSLAASAIPLAARTAAVGTHAAILGTGAAILGVRALPMIPAYVKERVSIRIPRPHFRRASNQEAPAEETTIHESPEAFAARTNVSGSILKSEEGLDNDKGDLDSSFRTMFDCIESSKDSEAEHAQITPQAEER